VAAHPFTCTAERTYVLLRYHADFPGGDLGVQQAALDAVDAALKLSRLRAAVFDTRAIVEVVQTELRDRCWQWAQLRALHDVVGLVASSDMVRVQANMRAVARRATVRSFPTLEGAAAWVALPTRPRR
jgi:hypothetical protein